MLQWIKNLFNRKQCDIPPNGWYCTRERGHEGPCAAWADNEEIAVKTFGEGAEVLVKKPEEKLDDGDFYITGAFGARGMKWSDYIKRRNY